MNEYYTFMPIYYLDLYNNRGNIIDYRLNFESIILW